MSCTKNQWRHKILVLEKLPKRPSTLPNAGGKYYCSQKLQKKPYLSELALKHEHKSKTKQTLLVGSTCVFMCDLNTNVQIWRMKLRQEHCVRFQLHPDMQWIQLQYFIFFSHLRHLQVLATYFNLSILNKIADLAANLFFPHTYRG